MKNIFSILGTFFIYYEISIKAIKNDTFCILVLKVIVSLENPKSDQFSSLKTYILAQERAFYEHLLLSYWILDTEKETDIKEIMFWA